MIKHVLSDGIMGISQEKEDVKSTYIATCIQRSEG